MEHASNASPARMPVAHAPIGDYMSASPVCIASHRTLAEAWAMMQQEQIRHLPVLEGGVVAGMISQRDLGLLEAQRPEQLDQVRVEDAMSDEPYVVGPQVPLHSVIATMATLKIGSAIVVEHGKVVGVFTTTDVIALLRRVLESGS
jgi:acetoin utilization protein AcuB